MKNTFFEEIPTTNPLLGRHIEHDPQSKEYPVRRMVAPSQWCKKTIRIWDPQPNPNQPVGCCTMCAKGMQFNAEGNRLKGVVLDMNWALNRYEWETAHDEFPGAWLWNGSGQDTGSSGLASCKTAQYFGEGGVYQWNFNGADGVADLIMQGHVVSLGTRWDNNMFEQDEHGQIYPGGGTAGGHQWVARGIWPQRRLFVGRCWWNGFRDFLIGWDDVDDLLDDRGDSHIQYRKGGTR